MRHLMLWASIMLATSALAACAESDSANTPPPTRSEVNIGPAGKAAPAFARMDTPEGEALIELVLDKRSISTGGQLAVRLVNRGDVPLLTGLRVRDERWNGERWVKVEREGIWAWRSIGIILKPGGSTEAQTWSFDGVSEPEPGRYRLTKSATYEGNPAHPEEDRTLVASAMFEVTSG